MAIALYQGLASIGNTLTIIVFRGKEEKIHVNSHTSRLLKIQRRSYLTPLNAVVTALVTCDINKPSLSQELL